MVVERAVTGASLLATVNRRVETLEVYNAPRFATGASKSCEARVDLTWCCGGLDIGLAEGSPGSTSEVVAVGSTSVTSGRRARPPSPA
jgi:hypothetical protein